MTDPSACVPRQTVALWGWACALSGCLLSPVQLASADANGISLAYTGAPYEHVVQIADQYCAQLDKQAWPVTNTPVGDAYHRLQKFECRAAPPPAQPAPAAAQPSRSRR